ncbi:MULTISPECIES: FHA domain-containing protein [Cryobacterium]|uniref:FHA domain-containing protein n=1 Tax=Cryobacterium breve TaxID=1259258 RepID=A0ABY2J8W9_9MICO|nr:MULTISPECIES: FHA domain-containing protein [Cryobacterium]TFC95227.1 FHA domain-containing protein [Cryobacterium sp. TmT3-12]TFD00317.1 FHA domain-containing protein [Cryobacterium breve]
MLSYECDESGDWLAATLDGQLVVVRSDGSSDQAGRLWDSLDGGVQGMLDGLTARGLFTAPSFVLVTWQGNPSVGASVNAIVRGDVSLRLTTSTGPEDLSGAGVATWREQSFTGVGQFQVECGAGADQRGAGTTLPLVAGVVRARHLTVVTRMSQVMRAHVAPAQVAPVVPAPVVAAPGRIGPVPGLSSTAPSPVVSPSQNTISDVTISASAFGIDTVADQTVVSVARKPHRVAPESVDSDHHDGLTVMSGDLRIFRDAARVAGTASVATHPTASTLFLLLPGGGRETLGHQPVVIGRAPSVNQVPGGQLPRLVSLGGADQDISRNHVRVTVEGDTVVVTDLLSRNGTVIVLPGRPPQKLRTGEAASVLVGTVIDLGGGVTITVGEDR